VSMEADEEGDDGYEAYNPAHGGWEAAEQAAENAAEERARGRAAGAVWSLPLGQGSGAAGRRHVM
jgi:hypothetical protein